MNVEFVELVVTEAGVGAGDNVVVAEFDDPVVLIAAHVIARPWTGAEAKLSLGTPDTPELLGKYEVSFGLTYDVANLPWPRGVGQPSYSRLVGAGLVDAIVARVEGRTGENGSGDVRVRLLVATPRIVEASQAP